MQPRRHARSLVASLSVVVASMAVGLIAVHGGNARGTVLSLLVIALLVMARARRVLLAATVCSLVLGSVSNALLKEAVFYARFELLGSLTLVNLLGWRRTRRVGNLVVACVTLGLLAVWAFLSVLWSVDPGITAERALSLSLLMAAVLSTVMCCWTSGEAVRRDLAIVAGVLGLAILGSLVTLLIGADWAYLGTRFRGIFENPNTLGLSGGLVVPLALGLASCARGRLDRAGWVGIALVTGLLLFLAQSRNGILGAVVGLIVLALARSGVLTGRPKVGMLAGGLALLLAVTLLAPRVERVERTWQSYVERGFSGRLSAWRLTWDMVRERPLVGWGFGTTEQVFGSRAVFLQTVFRGQLVHNGYLQLLLELGPIAPGLVLAAIGAAFWVGLGGLKDAFSCAVFGAFCSGSMMQGAESGIASAGSVFALNFWLLTMATLRLGTDGLGLTAPSRAPEPSVSRVVPPRTAPRL